ncbi:MAG TPA: 2-oxoglutarate dehydrogenase E1 component, partial [Planctomycetota bacterium]|nr:2-oxoglutarate dehydrogenase E1 component [Planctomycetota bacterium]
RAARSLFHPPAANGHAARNGQALGEATLKQDQVDQLVRAYRVRGHLIADLDPLGLPRRPQPELEMGYYGLSEADLDRTFSSQTISGSVSMTLRGILERLRNTYCRTIGVQFMHIDDLNVKNWLTERMESTENRLELSREEQLRILTRLTDAVIFEDFLQRKFLGAKRFSLEGGESLIPLLDLAIEEAGEYGVREIVFGMAHRGRINVLANILGKRPADIFAEFEDHHPEAQIGRGDVKYHLGYSGDRRTATGRDVHLTLCFNPSHLEFVAPVALGRLRAKQDRYADAERRGGMAILIHGDAAFIAQGVVQETLNLSQLQGYRVGGTIHVIVNNQVGFTTSPHEGRSCEYPTDIAKFLQVPIFHVNGEDPEAVAQVVRLALEFRHQFQRDVVIDMYCYRRYGHNEGDEPEFTQPLMYRAIRQRKSVRDAYLDRLLALGGIPREEAERVAEERKRALEADLSAAREDGYEKESLERMGLGGVWERYRGGLDTDVPRISTSLPAEQIARVVEDSTRVPEGFTLHPKLERLFAQRVEMARGERPFDWATAELAAFGTLALAGHPVRLSGQDSRRGTFSQRHAVAFDHRTGVPHMPLAHLAPEQGHVEVWNSPLSEIAVMGFEYGYSMDTPAGLVLWEAQFGDFVNVAQPIIDQFLVSAEAKWNRLSGLVLLLPHGFEGQGPEHSSARLERFLALAAEDNLQVVQPTTPAQYFNVLRRQVLRPWRKPLVVMTPKSLLRHPRATSTLADLSYGRFRRVLWDDGKVGDRTLDPARVTRILLCSGKVYYDLQERRERDGRLDVGLLRLEQLYPLAEHDIREALARYPAGTPVRWVQEEPENMGAWPYLQTQARFHRDVLLDHPISGVHRRAAAVPATGSPAAHKLEQEALLEAAFARD